MKAGRIIQILFVILITGAATLPLTASGQQPSSAEEGSGGVLNTENDYPIVKQDITMSIAVGRNPDGTPPEDKWFWKYMEDLTGITMEVQQLPPQGRAEKLNLMFATGELPNLMLHIPISNTDISRYGGQGFFKPLEGLIKEYGTNINRAFSENTIAKASVTSSDGHIYMLPGIFMDKESFSTQRPWINTLWLDNLGLDVPETLDDFYKVLVAFKSEDANGNGDPNDEIPFGGAWNVGFNERTPILSALGFVGSNTNIAYREGNVVFIPYDDAYIEYLSFMNRMWEEGLIDLDMFTQTLPQARAKYGPGVLGFCLDGAPFVFTESNWLEYDAFTPLISEWNDKQVWPETDPITLSRFSITQSCEYPEAAIRWADWFFTEENSVTFWGGPLSNSPEAQIGEMGGYGRYMDDTNRVVYNLPPDVSSSWQYIYKKASPVHGFNLGFIYGGGNEKSWFFQKKLELEPLPVAPSSIATYVMEEPNRGVLSKLSPGDASRFRSLYDKRDASYELKSGLSQEDQLWAYRLLEDKGWIVNGTFLSKDQYWRSRFTQNVTPHFSTNYPSVFFTPEEIERLDELETPLEDYIDQMEARFITGVEPLDNFEKFRNELKQLGVEEYLSIHMAAEKRFKAFADN